MEHTVELENWFYGGREGVLRRLFPGQEEKKKGRKEEMVEAALLSSTYWSRTRYGTHRRKPRKRRKRIREEKWGKSCISLSNYRRRCLCRERRKRTKPLKKKKRTGGGRTLAAPTLLQSLHFPPQK